MLVAGLAVALSMLTHADGVSPMGEESRRIVSQYRAEFTVPPNHTPHTAAVDGPLLGNGDMGVAIGGRPRQLTFWLSKNDFWRLKSRYGASGPRVFGAIRIAIPALLGADYRAEQELYDAVTRARFSKGKAVVAVRAWVAARANLLVIELVSEGKTIPAKVALEVAESEDSSVECRLDDGLWWGVREFSCGVDIPTAAACGMRVLGADGPLFSLVPGKPVTIAIAMQSRFKSEAYVAEAKEAVREMDAAGLAEQWGAHKAWWHDFWAQSYVDIGDPVLERFYYLSNYVLGSCSRDPDFPPPIFGTWNTTDNPAWFGDYHLNYNHMAPFYGLYSSNHIEQADPYRAPILDFMERGQWYAREALGCRGVFYPVGIGPKGIETTRTNTRHGPENSEKGGLFFGQKSNASYAVVNLSMRWRRTYDPAYARTVYPFIREVAAFWEDYLKVENGRYVIHKDAVHEGSGENLNSIVSLGLVRNVFETALDMSVVLERDADHHEKWRHILAHLSGFATQEKDGKTVFRYTEKGTDWWGDNTLGIQHIYPAGAIGLNSDPELLEVARNTIDVMDRWIDNNGMNSFFPAAVRVGIAPETILEHLRDYVQNHTEPNGFAAHNPHGIENCSIVPNTINEMLCMGHQDVLRVFAVWPRDRDARFANLRCEGAFLVSSALKDGEVRYVRIHSERGRPCTLENPWPGSSVTLRRNGAPAETLTGDRLTFPTEENKTVALRAS